MRKLAIAAAIVAASASTALAEGSKDGHHQPRGHGKFIEALDANKDGKVDAAEFTSGASERAGKRFDAIDAEGKGVISREQFTSSAEAEAKARFEKADRNGDGALTKEDRPKNGERRGGHAKGEKPPEKQPG